MVLHDCFHVKPLSSYTIQNLDPKVEISVTKEFFCEK